MQILDSMTQWPYPAVTDARRTDDPNGTTTWVEIDQERADYFLDVLPPIYFRGGFFVGEPASHDERGVAVHAAVVQHQERFFMREVPLDAGESNAQALRAFLRNGGARITRYPI